MLAALSVALKVVIVPLVLRRLLRGTGPAARTGRADIAGSGALGLASTVLIGDRGRRVRLLRRRRAAASTAAVLPATALSVSVSVVLVAFVLMIVPPGCGVQAIGLFSLENGVSLAAWWWPPACR